MKEEVGMRVTNLKVVHLESREKGQKSNQGGDAAGYKNA